ncbi:MAG TPA: 6-phosphogluconolactonase, partial [Pirellulales bacterium]|nr:6-phosphogluconolactonase [Pirellulales bacterium]
MHAQAVAAAPRNDAELRTFADQDALSRAAAEEIVSHAEAAVAQRGSFTIALSGGPAPAPVFDLLASPDESYRQRMPWNQTHFFWGD